MVVGAQKQTSALLPTLKGFTQQIEVFNFKGHQQQVEGSFLIAMKFCLQNANLKCTVMHLRRKRVHEAELG